MGFPMFAKDLENFGEFIIVVGFLVFEKGVVFLMFAEDQ